MKRIIAFLAIVFMMLSLSSCDISETVNGISDSIIEAGKEALGDYLREDESWENSDSDEGE